MKATEASSSAPSDRSPRRPTNWDVLQQQLVAMRAQLVASVELIDSVLGQCLVIAPEEVPDPVALSQATTKLRQAQGSRDSDPVATFGGDNHGLSSSPLVAQE
jgi:hypothetical protein